jgi:hypothetical protein
MIPYSILNQYIDKIRAKILKLQNRVTGNFVDSYQGIIDFWEIDCAGNWVLYIQTAIPAFGAALWLILTPSPAEIFESYLEPKAGRRGGRRGRRGERERRRNRRGRALLFFGGAIPDIDNMIADRIPGRGFFAGRRVGPSEWMFWTSIRAADAVGWTFLLVEALATFETKWMSGLINSGLCKGVSYGQANIGTEELSGFNNQNCWGDISVQPEVDTKNMTAGNNGSVFIDDLSAEATGHLAVSVEYVLTKDNQPGTSLYEVGFWLQAFRKDGSFEDLLVKTELASLSPNSTEYVTVTGQAYFEGFQRWHVRYIFLQVAPLGLSTQKATTRLVIKADHIRNV